MDMIDSIECVSSSDGMDDDDAVSSNLPHPFLKTSAAAAIAAAVVAASIRIVPSGGGAFGGGITGLLISSATSMHEPIHQVSASVLALGLFLFLDCL